MIRGAFGRVIASLAGGIVALPATAAFAQTAYDGTTASFIRLLSERMGVTTSHIPELGRHLANLSSIFDWRSVALLVGIVVAGLAAEDLTRRLLRGLRRGIFDRHAGGSPLRAFLHGLFLDLIALLALWAAARLVIGFFADPASIPVRVAGTGLRGLLRPRTRPVPRLATAQHAGRSYCARRERHREAAAVRARCRDPAADRRAPDR